jgi:diguanylate cyclase (GGDEF)-like protein/PAS domain S-box-containing protein
MSQNDTARLLLAHSQLFLGFDARLGTVFCSDWSRLGLNAPAPGDIHTGRPCGEVVDLLLGCIDTDQREQIAEKLRRSLGEGRPFSAEFDARLPGQALQRWLVEEVRSAGAEPESSEAGNAFMAAKGDTRWVVLRDIGEQRAREDQINELALAVENAMQGISKLDTNGLFTEVRPQYASMLGYVDPAELIGKSWSVTVAADDLERGESTYAQMLETGRGVGIVRGLRKDGTEFDKQLLLIKREDKDGNFVGHFCFMRDVSKEQALQRRLEHDAGHDYLTSLINRRQFEVRLAAAIEATARHGGQHVIIYLDLDQFKVINDTLGHVAGDHLLTELAAELARIVRARDTLARLGGDEFAILAEHCAIDDGVHIADNLLRSINDFETQWEGIPLKVGASAGIASAGLDDASATEVLKRADSACYVAKELGRNRIYVFGESDEEINQRAEQMRWISRIHEALKHDGFFVMAQPIVPTADQQGEARHYETLIRMKVAGENTSPSAFLPAAEKYNVAHKLDRWMIERVFALLAGNREWADSIEWISINLSGQTIGSNDFTAFVRDMVARHGVNPRKICFEITETTAVTRLSAAREIIETFRALGFRFALDDFGAGVSSFGYLQQLHVDFIKIDGMIVRNVEPDEASSVMVEAITRIAGIRGLQCIAEYVETAQIARRLEGFGVTYLQGYHFGRPRPLLEIAGEWQQNALSEAS